MIKDYKIILTLLLVLNSACYIDIDKNAKLKYFNGYFKVDSKYHITSIGVSDKKSNSYCYFNLLEDSIGNNEIDFKKNKVLNNYSISDSNCFTNFTDKHFKVLIQPKSKEKFNPYFFIFNDEDIESDTLILDPSII